MGRGGHRASLPWDRGAQGGSLLGALGPGSLLLLWCRVDRRLGPRRARPLAVDSHWPPEEAGQGWALPRPTVRTGQAP